MNNPKKQQKISFNPKKYINKSLKQKDIIQIKQYFDVFDKDKIGSLNPQQLKKAFQSLGTISKDKSAYRLIVDLCSQGRGNISFQQFVNLMTPQLVEKDTRQNIKNIFTLLDDNNTGYLNRTCMKRALIQLGFQLSQTDLQLMIQIADTDQDGFVSEQQFYNLISQYPE